LKKKGIKQRQRVTYVNKFIIYHRGFRTDVEKILIVRNENKNEI
jgi:hypothetical protein